MPAESLSHSFLRRAALQFALLNIALPLCYLAMRPFLAEFSWGAMNDAIRVIEPQQWAIAVAATCGSFAALGRYDVIAHRIMGSGVPETAAQASGAAAVALSQMLGFGLITGSIARWRAISGFSFVKAGAITSLVSFSFLWAWLLVFACVGLMAETALPVPKLTYLACLFSAFCLLLYTALRRHFTVMGRRIRLPSLIALVGMIGFAALDTGCAALALWALLPEAAHTSFTQLFAIYLACLGLCLISNAPAGIGPFELCFLWALQDMDVNALLGTLFAFRLVYFALPALCAAGYLFKPLACTGDRRSSIRFASAQHPETPAALQTGDMLRGGDGQAIGAVGRACQCAALVFDPATEFERAAIALHGHAQENAVLALFYKLGRRNAAQARRRRYAVLRISEDAVIDLAHLDTNRPSHRTLRRKLRSFAKSDLRIETLNLSCAQHWHETARLDGAWQARIGQARGFSMGRFCPEYLAEQLVLGAWKGQKLVALISVHKGQSSWALDLMRSADAMPDGTMHALVWRAACLAKAAGCAEFSLAASPALPVPLTRLMARLRLGQHLQDGGLRQFKRSFSPRWVPLYAAAKGWPALALGLWDVWKEICDPPPLSRSARPTAQKANS